MTHPQGQMRARQRGSDIETPARSVPAVPPGPGLQAWAEWILSSLLADEPFSYCAVLVLDPTGDALMLVDERWQPALAEPLPADLSRIPLDASVCGIVFRSGTPVLIADVRQHPDYRAVPGASMRSEIAVPVLRAGRTIAVINVESPRVGGLDIADLHRLTTCATSAAAMAPSDLRPIPEAA